jgi:hypothetical protein
MENLDIRILISESGLKYQDIAKHMKISRVWLSKLMRYPLTEDWRDRILSAIMEMKEAAHERTDHSL